MNWLFKLFFDSIFSNGDIYEKQAGQNLNFLHFSNLGLNYKFFRKMTLA